MTTQRPHWSERLGATDAAALAAYSSAMNVTPTAISPVLLVIDVTEGFVGPNLPVLEAQQVSRKACGERAWEALPNIRSLIAAFRARGLPIVYTRPDPLQYYTGPATARPDASEDAGVSNEFPAEIMPHEGDMVLPKVKGSVFFGTPLNTYLTRSESRTLVMCGGTTSGCVRASAVDGSSLGFSVLVAEDAVFDRADLVHDVSLIDINAKYGRVVSSDTIISLL